MKLASFIDVSALTKIGNLTGSHGLAGIFDGAGTATAGTAAVGPGTLGVRFDAPQKIDKVVLTSTSNGFDFSASTNSIFMCLYGKNGAAPATPSDGTKLGEAGGFKDKNQNLAHSVYNELWWTEWEWVWVVIDTSGGGVGVSDAKFYAPDFPTVPCAGRHYLTRSMNSGRRVHRDGIVLSGMRVVFELTAPAIVDATTKITTEHLAYLTGFDAVLANGGYLLHRTTAALGDLPTAPWNYLANAEDGKNLLKLEDHYKAILLRSVLQLEPGWHEITPTVQMNTTIVAAPTFMGRVHEENGRGLNWSIVTIDNEATLTAL